MSFLNQPKSQAHALQSQQGRQQHDLEERAANFPPDLERVQSRLAMGPVRHERKEVRHPDKNTLQAIEFEYMTETRGNVQVTPDHDQASLAFRLLNASGFGILHTMWPAAAIRTEVMDDLARLIVSEPNRFG